MPSNIGNALNLCQREYHENKDPKIGVWIAESLRQTGNETEAETLANELLTTPARADALRILGGILAENGHFDAAVSNIANALLIHRAENKQTDVAQDNQMLAQIYSKHNQYSEALRALDECFILTHQHNTPRDKEIEYICHLSAQEVLTRVGYIDLALRELDLATPLATSSDLVWLEVQRAGYFQELGRSPELTSGHEQAIVAFRRALELNADASIPGLAVGIELGLAYSLAEVKRTDDADRHLAVAQLLDTKHAHATHIAELSARIAYRRGSLPLAYALNEQIYPTISNDEDNDDERLDIATTQTRIALAQGDLLNATRWADCGVAEVERVRAAQSALELRPWILSIRREPYELLFVALARAGRIEDAIMALDRWQGRSMLDAMARPKPGVACDLREVARRTEKLGAWLPAISRAPFAQLSHRAAVLSTLRTTDLLALVVADGNVWRLTANRGQLRIDDLGPRSWWRGRIDKFMADPANRGLATELGELLLPDGMLRPTRDALHVLLDGQLAGWPIAALRDRGRALIAERPIVRVSHLSGISCVTPIRSGHKTVVADAFGDLSEARREAQEVAESLHAKIAIGETATAKVLFGAMTDSVLHVSVHGDAADPGGGVLKFADREVSAPEISALQTAPSLVVLFACDSAHSKDIELAGSLATAFLVAGADQVVATTRPVDDRMTREVAEGFYRNGGVADPVRALAAVQAELDESPDEHGNTDWPYFAVFGHDICSPGP